jgi:hypothetical protein
VKQLAAEGKLFHHKQQASGAGVPKSAMIEMEKQALERIKVRQQLEIQKMLG